MSTLAQRGLQISKNALFSAFIGRASRLLTKPLKIAAVLNEAADKLVDKNSKDNKFVQLFHTGHTLVRLVRNYISGEYRQIHTTTIASGLGVLLYVISPIDLVPDFIPALGFLDDLSLISWFIGKFHAEITRFQEWEQTSAQTLTHADSAQGDRSLPAVAELGHS
ncbi:YkvA family protein [Hymenobacter bucti]|uniref:YkvA family protein n=1 Tax=Hymenobacter bucti TaxID=1844114 RepID=A0ABW4R0I1_9BACT